MPGITVEDAGNGSSDSNPQRTEPVSHGARSLLVDQLQSRDHAELLSAIDRLRQEHIDKVKIPQIVVCGNQSSGKSSVLEAIAGVAFPIGSGTVTKFATEVILRKSSEERRRARIIASSEREGNLRRRIEEFERSFDSSTSVDFGRVITEAGNHLLQLEPNAGFWKDWLQIEIIGPSQPHLTLVDLPGIIQYDSDDPENAQKITGLLSTYVENPRTTVLAIIDALNNYQNQGILNIITETARDRTLGVITKTDRLSETDDIQNVISLAKNESVTLRLGWHVLRNLSHQDQDRSPARRDELERQFFARRDWSVLPRCDVGIESLRSKLSDQLLRSITIQLPGPDGLIANMRQQLHQCRSELRMLGPSRVTVLEQRTYLFDILNSLSRLIEDALDGDYEKEGFESFFGNSKDKRLRDKIRLETEDFVSQMELRGKQYHVSIRPDETGERLAHEDLDILENGEKPNFSAPFTTASSITEDGQVKAYNVHLKTYCRALARHMKATRGRNLPGMPLTITTRAIFRQLSLPWTGIAEAFAENCCNAVDIFLRLAIRHVAGEHTGNALLRAYIYPNGDRLERRRASLVAKIDELLWPFKNCHPITYHPSFNPTSPLKSYSASNHPHETWGEIARASQYGPELSNAADALDIAESYYNIAFNTLIENVATLGIEQCLLKDLSSFISPREAMSLEDNKIEEIAAEPAGVVEKRARAGAQEATLVEVIRVCRSYVGRDAEATQQEDEAQDEDDSDDSDYEPATTSEPEEEYELDEEYEEDEGAEEAEGDEGGEDPVVQRQPTTQSDAISTLNPPAQSRSDNIPQASSGQTQTQSTPIRNSLFVDKTTTQGPSLFGGSAPTSSGGTNFGGNAPTTFGSTNFGGNAPTTSGGGLFRNTAPSGNPFGQPASETSSSTTAWPSSGFGGFGQTSSTTGSTNIFVPQSSSSLFSQPRPSSAAGSPKPFAGGSTSSKYQPSVFYTPTKRTFGKQFMPAVDSVLDTRISPNRIYLLFQSMGFGLLDKFSLEELRLDDYIAGRIRPDAG